MAAKRCPNCGKLSGARAEFIEPHYEPGTEQEDVLVRRGWHCWSCEHSWVDDGELYLMAKRHGALCDFCSDPDPVATFRSLPFTIPHPGGLDEGYDDLWAACAKCAEFIRAGDRQGLLDYSIKMLIKHYPRRSALRPRGFLANHTRSVLDGFWVGGPVEV